MAKVLITGSDGFIAKNLILHFRERKADDVICFTRRHKLSELPAMLEQVDFVFHLAGVNRPTDPEEFKTGNTGLTVALCDALVNRTSEKRKQASIVFSSSSQAKLDNPYGQSKRDAEKALFQLSKAHGFPVHIFRLPNVFGKWAKPNYNSAVATFCHNIAHGLPITIHDPSSRLQLAYVDDVCERFLQLMDGADSCLDDSGFEQVSPVYSTTVGELAETITQFKSSRQNLMTERVGTGLVRALYSTYVSYLPYDAFTYDLPLHGDARGVFVEMLKTPDCGQFSYFTAHPGVTRGGHYHHSKTEKFLVIKGQARFKFRHMQTNETQELIVRGDRPQVVETVPGWTHDITNIGSDEMVVMLWANEVFDRTRPDTFACSL